MNNIKCYRCNELFYSDTTDTSNNLCSYCYLKLNEAVNKINRRLYEIYKLAPLLITLNPIDKPQRVENKG